MMKRNTMYGIMYFIYNIILLFISYILFNATNSLVLKGVVLVYFLLKGVIQMFKYYYGFISSITIKKEIKNNNIDEVKRICFDKYTIKSYVFDAVKNNAELMQRVIKICNLSVNKTYKKIYISTVGYIFIGMFWSWDMACYFLLPGILETIIQQYKINDEKKSLEQLKKN